MEQTFHEALREVRVSSRYPRRCDFIRVAGIYSRSYSRYESGAHLPELQYLEQIIHRCGIPEAVAKRLRELHAIEAARRLGVEMRQLPATLNVSELAERIQRETEYELKRAHLFITSRTRQVCIRRIEMLLKDALRIS
jgi:hypothetical protein